MEKRLYQIDISFDGSSTLEIMTKLSKALGIEININKILEALRLEERRNNPKALCMFKDKVNSDKFILLDCSCYSHILGLVIRCDVSESSGIKQKIVGVLNSVESYSNRPTNVQCLSNSYDDSNNFYNKALERCEITEI